MSRRLICIDKGFRTAPSHTVSACIAARFGVFSKLGRFPIAQAGAACGARIASPTTLSGAGTRVPELEAAGELAQKFTVLVRDRQEDGREIGCRR